MKKILILSVAIFAMYSCSNMLEDDLVKNRDQRLPITFEGGFVQAKTAFGEDIDGKYALTWSQGDAIGIFSYDQTETMNDNIKGILAETSIGMAKGLFVPVNEITTIPAVEEGGEPTEIIDSLTFPTQNNEKFLLYYPYKSGTTINVETNSVDGRLEPFQTQNALGDKQVGKNGFSTAMVDVKAGSRNAAFTLKHNMAYICFKAKSTEFAGYQLHSVELFDKNNQAVLSGDFSYSITDDKIVPGDIRKTSNAAKVKIGKHDFTATPAENELYLTVFAGDYSEADMYVSVCFMNEAGATYTIPFQFEKKCRFPVGSLTTIDLGDITSDMNKFTWYETYEERDVLDYYAYGHTNTYYAEHIIRPAEETKTTFSELTIDVKARGDFSKVAEPVYAGLVVPSEMGCSSLATGTRKLLALQGANVQTREAVPTTTIDADYTFKLSILDKTAGSGRWGTVGIFDANFNLLWSYLIITYEEGDAPKDVEYTSNITLMDRYLGQLLGNKAASDTSCINNLLRKQNKPIVKAPTFDHTGGNVLPFFQWGRKDPFAWTNTNGLSFYKGIAADDYTTIESGIKNPTVHYGYVKGATTFDTNGDWQNEGNRNDLWGGYNNTEKDWFDPDEVGHKTIFDPCPDGYRVPDSRVFEEVSSKAEIWETINGHSLQVTDPTMEGYSINIGSPFYNTNKSNGFSVLAYKLANGEYDYWFFAGYGAEKESFTARSSSAKNIALETWSNSVSKADPSNQSRACCMEYGYWSTSKLFGTRHSSRKAYRYPVRCQKITK